jgi:hypothetical protein
MKKAFSAESRMQEIASLTPQRRRASLRLTIAWKDLHRNMVTLTKELAVAKRYADKVEAIVNLDKAPEYLKEKGLIRAGFPAGSEDQRRSVLNRDETFEAAQKNIEDIQEAVSH